MKILVAGFSGQVARSLHERAKETVHEVVLEGRPELDISNRETVERAFDRIKPDILVNAAAYTAVDKAEEEYGVAELINSVGAEHLADVSAKHNCPIIHLSTDYVFDGSATIPYSESTPLAPLGAYGNSKLLGEQAVARANTQHIILRTAWVYSPFGTNFIKTMLRLAIDRDEISVVSDQVGSPTYAPDIADGIYALIDQIASSNNAEVAWGIYHLAGGGFATWADVAEIALGHSKNLGGPYAHINRISSDQYPTPAKRPANSKLDCSLLFETFNIRLPEWSKQVRECVERLVS